MAKAPKKVTLKQIVDAGEDGMLVDLSVVKQMVEDDMIEINTSITNEDGLMAARATAKGIATINGLPTREVKGFVLTKGRELPVGKPRGRSGSKWPFDEMEVGESFVILATDEKPNPVKDVSSAVSHANKRYAVPVEGEFKLNKQGMQIPVTEYTRFFVVKEMENGDACVFRMQ